MDVVVEPALTKIYDYVGQVTAVLQNYALCTYSEYLQEYKKLEKNPKSDNVEPATILMCIENVLACKF